MGRLPVGSGVVARSSWLVFRIAAAVTLVVVPFGYAITGTTPTSCWERATGSRSVRVSGCAEDRGAARGPAS